MFHKLLKRDIILVFGDGGGEKPRATPPPFPLKKLRSNSIRGLSENSNENQSLTCNATDVDAALPQKSLMDFGECEMIRN